MKRAYVTFLLTLSDLFINLSAGWFGTALILPVFLVQPLQLNILVLTTDISFGILSFTISFKLRRIVEEYI